MNNYIKGLSRVAGLMAAVVCLLTALTVITAAQAAAPQPVESPSPSLVKDGKCYEIRTYYAFPGKLEGLHSRFRNHTLCLPLAILYFYLL